MKVAVLGGGRSSEHDISLASAAAVRAGLEQSGHEPLAIEIDRDGRWSHGGEPTVIAPGTGLQAGERPLDLDVVFPVLHGPFGEDGTVQGLLEIADVPYVGAGVLASAVAMDKVLFKDLMTRHGVAQVDHVALRDGEDASAAHRLGFPLFVKPARLGSSVGISKVDAVAELAPALQEAFAHDPLAIVEAAAGGLEVECSVIGNGEPIASEPGEIVIEADWYDFDAKYEPGGMELVVPARIEPDVRDRVREQALAAYRAINCAGLARVDFFVEDPADPETVLVNELNTIPGFTETSVFAKLFEASGIDYAELLERLLALALERHEAERSYRF
jgi:D-alanine-D-alanine ligase